MFFEKKIYEPDYILKICDSESIKQFDFSNIRALFCEIILKNEQNK